jgi:hypothetical protein
VLARMAVVAAHEQTGGAEALMLIARDYAITRRAFGQVIGAFQSVKHRIAELYGLVEIARANCIAAAALEGQSGFLKAAAAARISATEAYDTAARDAVQVHGGIGVTWESGLHLHMRRARSLAIETGNILPPTLPRPAPGCNRSRQPLARPPAGGFRSRTIWHLADAINARSSMPDMPGSIGRKRLADRG